MILVFGVTGTTGGALARELARRGQAMRGVTRDPDRARKMLGDLRLELVKADLGKAAALEAAMEGVERMYLVSPSHPDEVKHQTAAIEAARKAGVQQVVKLSVMGASDDSPVRLLREQREIEKAVEASGMAWTVLRPQYFMQNTLRFAESIAKTGSFSVPMGDAAIAMIDVRDIASVAAAALTEDGHEGRVYEITGPEALTFMEVAEKLSSVLDRPVEYREVSTEAARKRMLESGLPEWNVTGMIELVEDYRRGNGTKVTQTVRDVTGREPYTYEQFARDHVDVFREAMSESRGRRA
jgi:uncharacterized protein YbjT (DUF2867 family)